MLVSGASLHLIEDLARTLQSLSQCLAYKFDNYPTLGDYNNKDVMLCPGHPKWDSQRPDQIVDETNWDIQKLEEKNEL